jgi:pyruvate dehydrogenase E1 component alpha subunit
MAVDSVAERAAAYAMPGVTVDGNDLPAVAAASGQAVARARAGEGPTLLECLTYRIRGHSKSDRNLYRTKEEIESWREADPSPRLEAELLRHGLVEQRDLDQLEAAAQREIDAALEFAKASPSPDPAQLARDVYAE